MGLRKLVCVAAAAATALTAVPAAAVPAVTDATSEALVLIPLTLTRIDHLEFGTLIPSAAPGTVTINATTGARTVAGGVTEVASDAGNRAYFGGAGSPGQQVLMALSPPVELVSIAGDAIPVLGMTLDGPAMRTVDPVARTFFVGVGGTLQIAADQPEGDYSADFSLTAIYQ